MTNPQPPQPTRNEEIKRRFAIGDWWGVIAASNDALAPENQDPEIWTLEGMAALKLGDLKTAAAAFGRILTVDPNNIVALRNRGSALSELGRNHEALALFDRAVALRPDDADLYFNRAIANYRARRPKNAEDDYRRALALRPAFPAAHSNLGIVLQETGRIDAARAAFLQAIKHDPAYAEAYANLGSLESNAGDPASAVSWFRKALAVRPAYADAHFNLGVALQAQGKIEAALESYTRAIALDDRKADFHVNRGICLVAVNRVEEGIESYRRALALAPHRADAHWNLALVHLVAGDYGQGWRGYEWRFANPKTGNIQRLYPVPVWRGDFPLAGRTILVHAEQGLGDTLQFARFIPRLAEAGANVVFEVQAPLRDLLAFALGTQVRIVAAGDPLPAFDCFCPLLSLPAALGTTVETIPAPQGYLACPPKHIARWREILGSTSRRRIGLVWSGNPKHKNDANRSAPLWAFRPFLDPDNEYIALQTEFRPEDMADVEAAGIRRFDDRISDFRDTAALCGLVDVVVSVDTSVAHLSGALGRPTRLLIPHAPDWRWFVARDDSPWYASIRVYRQTRPGDWRDAIARALA